MPIQSNGDMSASLYDKDKNLVIDVPSYTTNQRVALEQTNNAYIVLDTDFQEPFLYNPILNSWIALGQVDLGDLQQALPIVQSATPLDAHTVFWYDVNSNKLYYYNQDTLTWNAIFNISIHTTDDIVQGNNKFVSSGEKTAITHSNRSNLDSINQDLSTTSSPIFSGATIGDTTNDEIQYVHGATSNIQIQLDDKEPVIAIKNTAFNRSFETDSMNIMLNGIASAGSSNNVARADHVHPEQIIPNGSITREQLEQEAYDQLKTTGNVDMISQKLSFNNSTREFTIEPVDTEFTFFSDGQEFIKTGSDTVTIPNATGAYFIYYDQTGALQQSVTSFFSDRRNCMIAYIYYNATTGKGEVFARETHTVDMLRNIHQRLHSQGTVYANGLIAGNYSLVGDGSLNTDAKLSISDGTIYDEDIKIDIKHSASPSGDYEQILSSVAKMPIGYRLNTGWQFDTATDYPVLTGTRVKYNKFVGGNWTVADVSTNDYFTAVYVIATNNIHEPMRILLSQREDVTKEDAKANNIYSSLDLTGLPILEFRPLYRLIFQTNSTYANTPKAKLVDILDLRGISTIQISSISTTDHNSLSNRTDPNSHPSSAISYDNIVSGLSSNNVKTAIDEVVTKKTDKVSGATNGDFAGLDVNGNLTDSGHKDSDYVHMIGNETVAGVKTFSSIPVLSVTTPTASNHVASKAYADTKEPVITVKNTAFNQSFETDTVNIKMSGAVSTGASNNIARADHIHPSDTSKAKLIYYGGMYQDSSTGTALTLVVGGTAYQWTGTSALLTSGITYDNLTKQLKVNSGSDGVYAININCSATFDQTNATLIAEVYKGGVATGIKSYYRTSNAGNMACISLNGLIQLFANEALDLRFTTASNNRVVTIYRIDFIINRIG